MHRVVCFRLQVYIFSIIRLDQTEIISVHICRILQLSVAHSRSHYDIKEMHQKHKVTSCVPVAEKLRNFVQMTRNIINMTDITYRINFCIPIKTNDAS